MHLLDDKAQDVIHNEREEDNLLKISSPTANNTGHVKIGGLYRHYKGGQMVVIDVVTHTEDNERLAIYIHNGKKWARPESMFSDIVTVNGEEKPRFEYLGQYLDIDHYGGAYKNVK